MTIEKLITKTDEDSAEIHELLTDAAALAREHRAHTALVVLTARTERGERTIVRFIGNANTLLASAARAAHEVNEAIDARED